MSNGQRFYKPERKIVTFEKKELEAIKELNVNASEFIRLATIKELKRFRLTSNQSKCKSK